MHLEEGITGVNRIRARIATDLEGGVKYRIGKMVFRGADWDLIALGGGNTLEQLGEHVRESDPEGAPGDIGVDRTIRIVVKPVGENIGDRKTQFFPGPLTITELPDQAVAETS
jgi:hypothetical protein